MSSNTMVERAKVAALVALAGHGQTTDLQEALVSGDGRGSLKPGALDAMIRAAIAAMRNPTEAMLQAAGDIAPDQWTDARPEETWPAMVDAILTDRRRLDRIKV